MGSLTKAAGERGTTQPEISRQISILERKCGGRLFYRTGRGVTPTELGQEVLNRVKEILDHVDLLTQDVNSAAGMVAGDVRIGVLPWMYKCVVYPLFCLTRERFPEVRLHVFEGSGDQIDEWLLSGHVTIGLPYRYGSGTGNKNEQRLLATDFFLIGLAGDSLTSGKTLDFSRLSGVPLVLPGVPHHVRIALDEIARNSRISLNVVLRADSLQIQKQMVLNGKGYAILPRFAVIEELEGGALQAVKIVKPNLGRTVVLAMTSARPVSLASREVGRLIIELVADGALSPR